MTPEELAAHPNPTVEMLMENFPASTIGPTWATDDDGKFLLPERTLGWHVLAWIRENLINFNDDAPMTLTAEQSRFILWFYAIGDDNRFLYRAAILQRLKGWGKDLVRGIPFHPQPSHLLHLQRRRRNLQLRGCRPG